MAARFHRYIVGVLAAAGAGMVALTWSYHAVVEASRSTATAADGEASARTSAEAVRTVLDAALRAQGRPSWTGIGAATESAAEFPTTEVFAAPYVVAVVVRPPGGTEGGPKPIFSSPPEAVGAEAFVDAPPDRAALRIVRDGDPPSGAPRTYVAAFVLPRAGGPDAATVNVHVRPPTADQEIADFRDDALRGALLLGALIYILAAIGYVLRDHGARAQALEREKSSRLDAVRDMAGGIAHELRNPLNAIGLSVQVVERKLPPASGLGEAGVGRHFERIHLEIGRIKKVVDEFVKFARQGDLTLTVCDLSEIVRETLARFAADFEESKVVVAANVAPDVRVQGDRVRLAEAVAAVIISAGQSMKGTGGTLDVEVSANRREARIAVTDDGPAIDEARSRTIFEPYRHGRDQGGFALAVAKTVVESHGGRVEAASAPGRGCVVRLMLPRRVR